MSVVTVAALGFGGAFTYGVVTHWINANKEVKIAKDNNATILKLTETFDKANERADNTTKMVTDFATAALEHTGKDNDTDTAIAINDNKETPLRDSELFNKRLKKVRRYHNQLK